MSWHLITGGADITETTDRSFETRDECEDAYDALCIGMAAIGWRVNGTMWIDPYDPLYYRSIYFDRDDASVIVIVQETEYI